MDKPKLYSFGYTAFDLPQDVLKSLSNSADLRNWAQTNNLVYLMDKPDFLAVLKNLVGVLKNNNINCVIDVRSNPHSQRYQLYNKEIFELALKNFNIEYQHFGKEFGAQQKNEDYFSPANKIFSDLPFPISASKRPDKQKLNKDELIIDYAKFSKSDIFNVGIKKIKSIYSQKFICAIMCSEKEPINCHRMIMVSYKLKEIFDIYHILSKDKIISNNEVEAQLSDWWWKGRKCPIDNQNLFGDQFQSDDRTLDVCYKARNVFLGWKLQEKGAEY